MSTFNLNGVADATIKGKAKSLDKISVGEFIIGTLTNLQQLPPINGKPVCRVYIHCTEFDKRFNALLDGSVASNIDLKGREIDLVFRGINDVRGTKYPKFTVLF